jgi:hypothetical protein
MKQTITGEINTNTPCFYSKGGVYFLADFQPLKYTISGGEIGYAS